MKDETMYKPQHLNRWTLPDSYFGAEWPEYFVFLSQHRESDELTESNFATGLARLGGESETVKVVRESHWAVGWCEWIAIHESDATALEKADDMAKAIADYPALDEDDWSLREYESAKRLWAYCFSVKERIAYIRDKRDQFEFSDFADLLGCARGRYFAGYASELLY